MLPIYCGSEAGNSPATMDAAFSGELTKTSLFEIVPISRAQMQEIFGCRQFSSVEVLPGDLLARLEVQFGVDAVLFTDITHYFPYLPISVGVRSKLVDVRSGHICWAFDYIFDSGKPAIAHEACSYFFQNNQTNRPIKVDGSSVLQSPARFSRYVAWETYRSLLVQQGTPSTPSKIVLNVSHEPPM